MKINFSSVGRLDDPIHEIVEMPAAPRVDDTILFAEDAREYRIHHVVWTPYEADYDAYVVLR